jgi:hypothetical protein
MPVLRLFIGVLDVENTVAFWDRLMEEGSIAIAVTTVSLIHCCRDEFGPDTMPELIAQTLWTRSFKLDPIYEYYSLKLATLNIDEIRREEREKRAKQWNEFRATREVLLLDDCKFTHEDL